MSALASSPRQCDRILVLSRATAQLLCGRLPPGTQVCVPPDLPPKDGQVWRFVTSDNRNLDLRLAAACAWERPPYVMLLRLVMETQEACTTIAEAVVGVRGEFAALLDNLASTMVTLLRGGLSPQPAGPNVALPPLAPVRQQPLRLAFLEGSLRRTARRWQERLLCERWAIGVIEQPVAALIEGEPLAPVTWIEAGDLGDLADPHPWPGSTRILCEAISRDPPGLGRIVALQLDAGSPPRIASATDILGGQMHRSYPGAQVHAGESLLLPETPVRGETTIYILADGGTLTPACRVAAQLRMADPTLFWHAGLAWIAYTDLDLGIHDNLCLLHAPEIRGPWQQHRRNPVKIDIRSSRPAGPILRHRGALYRPAQDCARGYGAAVVLHRIEALSTDLYQETPVRRIEPRRDSRFPDGLHTFAPDGDRILVDGKRLVLEPGALAAKLYRPAAPPLHNGKALADA